MNMVVDYKARKNEVLESYSKLEELIADLQDYSKNTELPDPVETMNALLRDIRGKAERVKEDRFNIMVAGEAKSGKSTFINAYLGVELLPMDVKQCTSAIVKIKYGDTFKVIATYAGGRKETITGDEEARKFLKENAALDDEYRDIPVPTINSEILVKSGRRAMEKGSTISIQKSEVQAMLDSPEVQAANIYGLPDYNERIKAYIEERKNTWEEIVTKIEIFFPFVEDLKGIEIIDSPGVCTRGGVSEITSQYIKNADAVIFLKPVIGQSLESAQFSQFMENASVERNKNALFLVLTHIATKNEADIRRLEEEAHKQFLKKIDESHILFVDSKAELYSQQLADVECLEDELRILKKEGTLDSFVVDVYEETHGLFGTGEDFIKKLHDKSRFAVFYNALELFGRCAHYLLLAELLDSMNKMYAKLWNDTNYRIELFRQKAEDPTELARKIGIVKQELDIIQNKLSKGTDDVVRRFRGDKDNVGIIRREAEAAVTDFLDSVGKISPKANDAFEQLEKVSLAKIDQFVNLSEQLQKQVVDECDKELIELTDKSTIHYESIKPDFTEETFKKIKDETKSKATETGAFEEGLTFKKTHTYSHYKQNDHFEFIKNNIQSRLEILKNDLIENLEEFIENIRTTYINALAVNANAKKDELDKIMEAKKTAEQMQEIISTLTIKSKNIQEDEKTVEKIRGGIFKYVQR
jgi:GTPase SAR1 family protein